MKQIYIAVYTAIFLNFVRKTLDRKVITFKIACMEYERRRDRFVADFRRNHPDEPFLCPVLPFSPPDGWTEED